MPSFLARRRQLARASALLAAIAVTVTGITVVATGRADSDPTTTETVTGELSVAVGERFDTGEHETFYEVKDAAGRHHRIETGGRELKGATGDRVRIRGQRRKADPNALQADPAANASFEVLSRATPPARLAAVTTPAQAAARTINLGVIMVNFRVTDGSTALKTGVPFVSAATVQSRFFTAERSMASYYRQASRGRLSVTGRVAGTVTIDVSGTNATTCATSNWADLADRAAANAGINLSGYTNRMYMLPFTDYAVCNWLGLGQVGGTRTWYSRTLAAQDLPNNPMFAGFAHEIGHNLGMQHAAGIHCTLSGVVVPFAGTCTKGDYDDPYDNMGGTDYYTGEARMPTASHLQQQGWLDGGVNNLTASGSYALSPSNIAGAAAAPKLLRIPLVDGTYDLEYRAPTAPFDGFAASSPAVTGLSIRYVPKVRTAATADSQLIDTTPATKSMLDAPLVSGTYTDSARSITVAVSGRSNGIMTVAVTMPTVPGSATPEPNPTATPVPTPDLGQYGDLNGDGSVNINDLSRLLTAYGTSAAGDVNGDGITGIQDLSILLKRWTG